MTGAETAPEIAHQRLYNQHISQTTFDQPGQVAAWMGAMQAQDYASAKCAVGLRCRGATDASIEAAIAGRTLLRTWLLRGTLHFVAAGDVRWMLALIAPRLIASSTRRNRELELDQATYTHGFEVLVRILEGGNRATRTELMSSFEQAGLSPKGQRGYHILAHAALEGLICFGPQQGKQQTFVLLDEWAPTAKRIERDEALAELAGRYFASHGPATLQDFTWWSGLAAAEARTGLELVKNRLQAVPLGDQTYWLTEGSAFPTAPSPTVHLLPAFDEYFLGYTHRDAILNPRYDKRVVSGNGVFRPILVIDGQVVGVWNRQVKKGSVIITPGPFTALSHAEDQAVVEAANRYGAFLGLPVVSAKASV